MKHIPSQQRHTEPFEGVLGKVADGVSFGGVREAVNDGWKLHHVTPNNNNSSYSCDANRCVNFAVNYTDRNCFVNFAENSIDSLLVSSL